MLPIFPSSLRPILLSLAAVSLVAACSSPPERIAAPALTPEGEQRLGFASVEIRDVSLPGHAQGDEVMVEGADGLIRVQSGLRWADDPTRATTLDLVRGLGALSQARIAGEPWPYNDYPAARVEVRVEEFLASELQGSFRVTGQFYVADLDGQGRDRTARFAIERPLPEGFGPADIARARAEAMAALALDLAQRGLR